MLGDKSPGFFSIVESAGERGSIGNNSSDGPRPIGAEALQKLYSGCASRLVFRPTRSGSPIHFIISLAGHFHIPLLFRWRAAEYAGEDPTGSCKRDVFEPMVA